MKKFLLLAFALSIVLVGCGQVQLASGNSDDMEDNVYLAKQLFIADFEHNFDLLSVFTEDVLISADNLVYVEREAMLLDTSSVKMFFPYHLCEIQENFLPEPLREGLNEYYETFWQYIETMAHYTQTHDRLSPKIEEALRNLLEFLQQQLPYSVKYRMFECDQDESGQIIAWLQDCTDGMLAVIYQAELENT